MLKKIQSHQLVLLTAFFVLLNVILLVNDFFWLGLLPIILIVVFLVFFSLEKFLLLIVFFTPLSFSLENLDFGGIGMFLPTEPLLFGTLFLCFVRLIQNIKIDTKITNHPITYAILFYLIWMTFTILTSEMPLVSVKFLISRMWFILPFYFLGASLFRNLHNIKRFLWLYLTPLSVVILITSYKHSLYYFDLESAHLVMYPFFKDHTIYGAVIAFMIPLALYLFSVSKKKNIVLGVFVVLALGLVLSFSRAAWVSVAAASIFAIVLRFRISFSKFIAFAIIGIGCLLFSWNAIILTLENNTQDSSSSLSKHLESVANISTDASNLERINRWNCAIRMFKERPLVGWGPGTYAFQYAPFQRSKEKTIISTNQGDLGNAHSEFLGPLAESGILGLISFLLLMLVVYYKGMKLYYNLEKGKLKNLVFCSLLSLTTYFTHGFLNNFLDTDKLAIPFWSCIAFLLVVDIYYKKKSI